MTLLQLAIRLSNSSEGIDAGNGDFQFSLVDTPGEISQDRGARPLRVALGLDAIPGHRLVVTNRIDTLRSDAKLEGKFDIISTEGIDKCIEVIIGGRTKTLLDALPVGDRDDTVIAQPLMVSRTRQANHLCTLFYRQLHHDGADPTCGTGDCKRVSPFQRDGTNGRVGCCPDDKQRASGFPGDVVRTMDKVASLYHDKLCLAGPLARKTNHLIACGKTLHSLTDSGDNACHVTTLSGRKCSRPAIGKHALTDGCLTRINTGCLDIDKDLPPTWCWSLDIDNLQHFDPTILIN